MFTFYSLCWQLSTFCTHIRIVCDINAVKFLFWDLSWSWNYWYPKIQHLLISPALSVQRQYPLLTMFCYGSWFYILLYRIWKIRYDKNTNIRKMITNTWSKRKDSSTCTKNWVTLSGWSWTTTTARRRCHSRGQAESIPPAVPALVLSAVCDSINRCDSVPCLIKVSMPPPPGILLLGGELAIYWVL